MARKISVLQTQTIWDVALQEAGTLEAAIEIAVLNDCSLSTEFNTGEELLLPDTFLNENTEIVNLLKERNIKPGTATLDTEPHGIGIDALGLDFEIG